MGKRNASASALGWDFQVNAAIVLMLENIQEAQKVCVEGEYEDIEIFLEDKTKIYSQVKSVEKPDDYSNVIDKLKAALETLNDDAANGDGKLYTYITNSPNPFNNQKLMSYFTGNTHLYFNELPDKAKEKIEKIIKDNGYNNLDTEEMDVRVIPFYGRDPKNRYKEIYSEVDELLLSINPSLEGLSTNVIPVWQGDFFYNATQEDAAVSIEKKQMIWQLIVLVSSRTIASDYKKDFDDEEIEEIERKYQRIMNETLSYEFSTRIISSYQESGGSIKKFIEEHWHTYLCEFEGIDADDDTKEALIKIILYRILEQRRYINDIKKGVNL